MEQSLQEPTATPTPTPTFGLVIAATSFDLILSTTSVGYKAFILVKIWEWFGPNWLPLIPLTLAFAIMMSSALMHSSHNTPAWSGYGQRVIKLFITPSFIFLASYLISCGVRFV